MPECCNLRTRGPAPRRACMALLLVITSSPESVGRAPAWKWGSRSCRSRVPDVPGFGFRVILREGNVSETSTEIPMLHVKETSRAVASVGAKKTAGLWPLEQQKQVQIVIVCTH